MLAESSLRIDVGELVRRPGASKRFELDVAVPGLVAAMGRVQQGETIHAQLLMEALVEGILVSGTLSGDFVLECSRCLVEFRRPFSVHVNEVYAYPELPEFEEGFVVEEDTVDLVPMMRDEILLSVPANPLHDEECKGLCPVCGQDVNVADCGHDRAPVDIRWEPLRRLKDELGN